MHAITVAEPGGPEVLTWAQVPDPVPGPGQVLVDVVAAGVNRADLLQRQGFYPPPAGASDILGLECAGRVAALGDGVSGWSVGDPVCALLSGGGYAERVVVPAGQLLPVPAGVDLVDAAGLPEVACTVWSNLVGLAGLHEGQTLLVHGAGSGIGTFATQLAHALGVRTLGTVGSAQKAREVAGWGTDVAINYRETDFVAAVREATGGVGADVILDIIGAAYLARNVEALAADGHLVVIGLQGGATGELNLGALLAKRGSVHATSLRARPAAQKAAICAAVAREVWPRYASGELRPVVHARLPMPQAAAAHRMVAESEHVGKVLLTLGPQG